MATVKIDAEGVKQSIAHMVECFDDLGFEAVGEDLRGAGDDPRSPFLAGCVRHCSSADALKEIMSYMGRLEQTIRTEQGINRDTRGQCLRIWQGTMNNLNRCVRTSK